MIDSFNKEIYSKLIDIYPYLQLGYFDPKILFIGQNPGYPASNYNYENTEQMRNGEISYKELIKRSLIGKFLSNIIDLDSISFTNIVKIPTINNEIPSKELSDIFWPITERQIELLKPELIVCLGKYAGSFLGLDVFYKKSKFKEIPTVMIPHPSAILRMKNSDEHLILIKLVLGIYKIINAWDYDDGIINIVIRENNKKEIKKISSFQFYFYIDKEDIKKLEEFSNLIKIKEDDNFIKVYASKKTSEKIRTKMKTYEADLSLTKRFILDYNIQIENNLKILFFDIETDDSIGTIEIGRDKILSWAGIDSNGKIYYATSENEKELLEKLKTVLQKHDIICGWNSSKFDLPYIKARFRYHNIYYNFKENLHIDLMRRYIKLFASGMVYMGLKGFSLNDMSETFLGKKKIEINTKIYELYKNDRTLLKKYNIQDAYLLKELNDKMKTIDLMIRECAITKTLMDKFFIGNLLDDYILTESNKRGLRLLSKPTQEELEKRNKISIRGSYVMKPLVGYYSDVYSYDFKSLYPSIIVGWNIGVDSLEESMSKNSETNFNEWLNKRKIEDIDINEWESFLIEQKKLFDPNNEYIQTANNQFFKRNRTSFIGQLIKNLLNERVIYKKELDKHIIESMEYNNIKAQENIVKEMANSMFGITADKESRYFDPRICEGITLTGQYILKITKKLFENINIIVLYGDTDSSFVLLNKENPHNIQTIMNNNIKKYIDTFFNLNQNILFLEYEKEFSKFLLLEKKRYCGILSYMDGKKLDKMFYRGIEVIQKSTILYSKLKMEEILNLIMRENKDHIYIKNWIYNIQKETMTRQFDKSEIMITTKINRPSTSYKTSLPHIRIAKKLIAEQKMIDTIKEKNSWSQIKYVVTDFKNKKEIPIEEYSGKFDREYYWNVKIYSPIKRMLTVIFPTTDWESISTRQLLIFQ